MKSLRANGHFVIRKKNIEKIKNDCQFIPMINSQGDAAVNEG